MARRTRSRYDSPMSRDHPHDPDPRPAATTLRPARVRVPCSSSNLGAGFDCIGLALDRYLEARFEPDDGDGVRIVRTGTLTGFDVPADDDFIVRAFLDACDDDAPSGVVYVDSEIPVAKGLGSSAAAVVAGLALGGLASSRRFEPHDLLADAVMREGHPDNAAPALLGGLVAVVPPAWRPDLVAGLHVLPLALSPGIGFAFAAPAAGLDTKRARAALPREIDHALAARAVAHGIALVHALTQPVPDRELIRAGFHDYLHVPFRLPLILGARAAMDAAIVAGAWAATISGGGSGLLAVGPAGGEADWAEAMAAAFRREAGSGEGIQAFPLRPDLNGLTVLDP
jgi:homoserine kinase